MKHRRPSTGGRDGFTTNGSRALNMMSVRHAKGSFGACTRILNWDECKSRDEDGKQFGRHGLPKKESFKDEDGGESRQVGDRRS